MTPLPLDRRLLQYGKPVTRITLTGLNSWFSLTRAPGPDGVILHVRVPGRKSEDLPYPDRAAALIAARKIYDTHRQAGGQAKAG